MGLWRSLQKLFNRKKSPVLQSSYQVLHRDVAIAILSEPEIADQFWVSFRLIPLTDDPHLLNILYHDNSWDQKILTISESSTGQTVLFLLALDWLETDEEVTPIYTLLDRPERVLLRGPYKADER